MTKLDKNGLIYGIRDVPKHWYEWLGYPIQMVTSVFVATVLISNICGTPTSGALFGAFVGTLVYELITGFKSPVFISSSGATVSAVCGALAIGDGNNYLMVAVGGAVVMLIYAVIALLIKISGKEILKKILPVEIVGAITIVIGLNLAKFLVTYCNQGNLDAVPLNSSYGIWCVICALVTMFVTALVSHYGKGFVKNIPFLFGLAAGYFVAWLVTVCDISYVTVDGINVSRPLIDFSVFDGLKLFSVPEFGFKNIDFATQWSWSNFGQTLLYFVPVSLAACCEHYSDHKTLSNIIGTDLTETPGVDRTLLGDGVASFVGTLTAGLPNTSYGESIATIGFSKVASVWVSTAAAVILGALSFIEPVCAVINSIPSFVFGGAAMILYGFIAASGLRTLMTNNVDLNNQKSLILVSVVLTVGVGGIAFINAAFAGVSLAMVLGIILNLILRENKKDGQKE